MKLSFLSNNSKLNKYRRSRYTVGVIFTFYPGGTKKCALTIRYILDDSGEGGYAFFNISNIVVMI